MSNMSDVNDHPGEVNKEMTTEQEYNAAKDMFEAMIENQADPHAATVLKTFLAILEWLWGEYSRMAQHPHDSLHRAIAGNLAIQISNIHETLCKGGSDEIA